MKQLMIQVKYEASKLSALKQYADLKDMSIDKELCDTITRLYDRCVPAAVREFIEMNSQENDDIGQEQNQAKKERVIVKSTKELPRREDDNTLKTQSTPE